MKAAVVALGKIGLPLAVQIAESGVPVVGVDIAKPVIEAVNKGVPPFPGETHLDTKLKSVVDAGKLEATDDFSRLNSADVIIVVVPVIVDVHANPDLRAIDSASREIAANMKSGALISYETTLPIHTTRKHFVPLLESESGLKCGTDFFVCHSPERVFTGRVFQDLRAYPKLVGGVDEKSAEIAVDFYEKVLQFDVRDDLHKPNGVWDLGSAEAAELAKLAETTYRNVNIGFANELALHADEINVDVDEVITASNSQPFSHIHRPGISVGGHCIPVYPKFYLSVDTQATLPAASVAVNESMPERAAKRLEKMMGTTAGKTVAILGAAYRGGVKETAFSGVFPLVKALEAQGARALVNDPMYTDDELAALGLDTYEFGSEVDGCILHTNHVEYNSLTKDDLPGVEAIFDGRRVLNKQNFEGVKFDAFGAGAN